MQPYIIDVDLKQKSFFLEPTVTQLDDVTFIVRVADKGQPVSLSGTYKLVSRRPDRKSYYTDGTKTGENEITFNLGKSELEIVGKVHSAVQFIDASNKRISSIPFSFNVIGDLSISQQPTSSERTLLEVVIQDGPGIIEEARQVAAENKTRFLPAVDTVTTRDANYPAPLHGDTIRVTSEAKTYRFVDGSGWVVTDAYNPTVIDNLTAQMAQKAQQNELDETKSRVTVQENKKISQTDLTTELAQQISGNAPINAIPADYSIVQRQFKHPIVQGVASKNLFDKTDIIAGMFVNYANGSLSAIATHSASNFIPIEASTFYAISGTTEQCAFYDVNKTYISGITNTTNPFQSPSNAKFVRLSMLNTQIDVVQLEKGNVKTSYISFKPSIDLTTIRDVVPESKLDSILIRGNVSKNLFNKETVTPNKMVHYGSGAIWDLANYSASDFISVLPSTEYRISGTREQGAFYDVNKQYISGFIYADEVTITPANAYFIRLTAMDAQLGNVQVEQGNKVTGYESFGTKIKPSQIKDIPMVNIINVKQDGTGDFTTIKGAIDSIKDSNYKNVYEVHIYGGEYDLVQEFGGLTWINSVTTTGGERQGLVLPDYVHLIGHGSVVIKCEVPDEQATVDFTTCVSTINIWENNNLENITFTARNTRYVCHDETNNQFHFLKRNVKNCKFIHYGNKTGMWLYHTAYAGGTGSGGIYDFQNCVFRSPYKPFSFHNNENQEGNTFSLDGCDGVGGSDPRSFSFGYYKLNTKRNSVYLKNIIADKDIRIYKESAGVDSTDVWDVYNFTSYPISRI